jgi:hypothetical protein
VLGVTGPALLDLAAQSPDPLARLDRMVVGLEDYFARAIRIVSQEEVSLERLTEDRLAASPPRRLVYERRTERPAATIDDQFPDARIVRRLLKENGRAPRPNAEPECGDLLPEDDDPLTMFLGVHRRDYVFKPAGEEQLDGRRAAKFTFESTRRGPVETLAKDDCLSVNFEAGTSGRVWIDMATDAILRLDTRLSSRVEFRTPWEFARRGSPLWMSLDRWDTSLRFRPVAFTEPDETLILPVSIEMVWTFSGSGRATMRSIQRFSDYHRFVTSSRIIQDGDR